MFSTLIWTQLGRGRFGKSPDFFAFFLWNLPLLCRLTKTGNGMTCWCWKRTSTELQNCLTETMNPAQRDFLDAMLKMFKEGTCTDAFLVCQGFRKPVHSTVLMARCFIVVFGPVHPVQPKWYRSSNCKTGLHHSSRPNWSGGVVRTEKSWLKIVTQRCSTLWSTTCTALTSPTWYAT